MKQPATALVAMAALTPAPWNPRTIKDERFKNLVRSIEADPEFLWRRPILASADGTIYAGNMRYRAATHIGLAEVPAIVEDVPEQLAKERALRDNAQWGDWHEDQLAELVYGLKADGADIDLLGMTTDELARLLNLVGVGGTGLTDPDDVPETPEEPTTKPGDLWLLGEHRVLCGDATRIEAVWPLMDGAKADMIWTDPPYGVNVTGKGGNALAGDISFTAIPLMFDVLPQVMAPGAWVYICGGQANGPLYSRMFERYFRQLPQWIIWDKGKTAVMRHNGYHSCYEVIYWTYLEGGGARWFGGRKSDEADDIWREPAPGNEREHVTEKPVALPARAIGNSCPPDGITLDPFLGVGSALIACEQLGRRCYGLEIEPRYVDVIVKRWEQFTGKTAVLAD